MSEDQLTQQQKDSVRKAIFNANSKKVSVADDVIARLEFMNEELGGNAFDLKIREVPAREEGTQKIIETTMVNSPLIVVHSNGTIHMNGARIGIPQAQGQRGTTREEDITEVIDRVAKQAVSQVKGGLNVKAPNP